MEISLYEPIEGMTAKRFRDSLLVASGPVTVAINSGGGNVTDGMAIFNALRTYKGHTVARIDGIAASMATIVALGAKRVAMADNGWWMMYNPWGVMAGEAEDMVLETLPDILERDCALTPTAVTRVQIIIDDLRDEMARKIYESESEEGWPRRQK